MRNIISGITDFTYRVTVSTRFFFATVCLLVFQSAWMAFTAIYPLPFDEYFHIGVIQIYARQWSPFIMQQPPEASLYGDITRMNSYLYHYLMSFPYRVLDTFIDSQMAMVISLRLINVAMVVAALLLFRKLFLMWKVPRRVMHVVFLAFVVTPIVPFVAAHVNYDNLVLLLMPIVLIFGTRLIIDRGDVAWNGALYGVFGLAAVLAKETFLPLYAIISLYVLWRLWCEHGKSFWQKLRKSVAENIRHGSYVVALTSLLILGGLFVERYGVNLVRYKSFIIACDVVQPERVCENFGPWYRDHRQVHSDSDKRAFGNPLSFSQYWVTRMMRGYYAIFQHTPTKAVSEREPYGPIASRPLLPLPIWVGTIALLGGLLAVALQWRRILGNKPMRFMLVVCAFYVLAVWIFNYQSYLSIGMAQAIQARYTYPVLLLLFVLFVQSANWSIVNKNFKAGLALALVPLYVWGGGIAGWLIRADDSWRWQNGTTQNVNHSVQRFLLRTVIH